MKQEFAKLTSGSTHKTIYQPVAAGLGICVPPLYEQAAVVQLLDEKLGAIDSVVERIRASVQRLAEYRASLVTAAITGKLDLEAA
jgi:type I restriction enzyme S subunit